MHTAPTRRLALALSLFASGVSAACSDGPTVFSASSSFAARTDGTIKGAGGGSKGQLTVTAVDPSWGHRGELLERVRISGSGFDPSAEAVWELDGVPSLQIQVLSTRYVDASTLEADILLAEDAALDLYDVAVTIAMSGNKKRGVGIEMFEVTTAQVIAPLCTGGTSSARGVNDLGQVTGHSCTSAFYWDAAVGTIAIGEGIALDIDESGNFIVGAGWSSYTRTQDGPALIWQRSAGGWTSTQLPSNGRTARANKVRSGTDGAPVVIAGQYKEAVNKRTSVIRPALWVLESGTWTLQPLPMPPGLSSSTNLRVRDANALRQAVGGWPGIPIHWEPQSSTYAAVILPGSSASAHGISADGSLIVGQADGAAAYWERNSEGSWSAPRRLSACTSEQTWANAVSGEGLIVGRGCGVAAAWRVEDGTVTELPLRGLGVQDASQEAWDAGRKRVVGNAKGLPVYWDWY